MLLSSLSVNSPGNLWSQSVRRKSRLRWEGFTEKERKFTSHEQSTDTFIGGAVSRYCTSFTTAACRTIWNGLPHDVTSATRGTLQWRSAGTGMCYYRD